VSEPLCPVCRKPFEPLLDPKEWHSDPPQVCSKACREEQKRLRAEAMKELRERGSWT
jgi:hypothetical protein